MYGSLGKSVVEDYPAGYPRFSALIATHDSFYICRRFSNLRARLLLLKQDKLASLERHLQRLHQDETNVLRLGSSRRDDNVERQDVLRQIDAALEDYDAFIERNHRTFAYETASAKLVSSLLNWVDGNGCIARAETAYLDSDELISIASIDDTVMVWLETWVEKVLIHLQKYCGKKNHVTNISSDPNVLVFPKSSTKRVARVLMTPIIVTLLLAPVVICTYLKNLPARLCFSIVAASMFIAILAVSTRAKSVELVVAGATYMTVLIVFITSTNGIQR